MFVCPVEQVEGVAQQLDDEVGLVVSTIVGGIQ
jgi:hypothetical protein